MMWGANMDIQFVGERSSVLNRYITSYITKAEKNVTEDLWNAIDETLSLRSRLLTLSRRLLRNREVGQYEAIDKLLGHSCFYSSHEVKFLSTAPKEERKRKLKSFSVINEMRNEDENIFHNNLIDTYYPNRPDELETECLKNIHCNYEYQSKKSGKNQSDEHCNIVIDGLEEEANDEEEESCEKYFKIKNGLGWFRRRTKPKLIKTQFYKVADTEGIEKYYRSILFLFKPWRKEEELLSGFESYKEAFEGLLEIYPQMKKYDESKQNVRKMIELAKNLRLETDEEIDKENMAEECAYRIIDEENEESVAEDDKFNPLSLKELEKQKLSLNDQQKKIYEDVVIRVEEQLIDEKVSAIRLIVSGVGGTGKSHLIQILTTKIRSMTKRTDSVAIVAPTGIAAFNVGGRTIHKYFKIVVQHTKEGKQWQLSTEDRTTLRNVWKHLKLIIIDEFSMVANVNLARIHKRLEDCLGDDNGKHPPFCNKNILLFGDLLQLPPVNAHFCFVPISWKDRSEKLDGCCGIKYTLWSEFQYEELTQNMRQKEDLEYANMLNRIRIGSPTAEDIVKLKSRQIIPGQNATLEEAAEKYFEQLQMDDKVLCLLPTNKLVDDFNEIILKKSGIKCLIIEALDITRSSSGGKYYKTSKSKKGV